MIKIQTQPFLRREKPMVMKEATYQKQQEEVRVKAAEHAVHDGKVMAPPSEEEVRDRIEAQVKSLEDELYARLPALESGGLQPQVAGPIPWWDLFVLGPIQFPPFLQPSGVIAVGETAFIATLLVVNPAAILPGPISPLTILGGTVAKIRYRTGNLNTWTSSAPSIDSDLLITGAINLDFQAFTPMTEGVMDLSVSARIPGPGPAVWPFGGHASLLFSFDSEPLLSLFGFPGSVPGFANKVPCRFSVFQPD
jgi:hypothetical protein